MQHKKLKSVTDYSKGKSPKDKGSQSTERNIPYIDIKAFETGTITTYSGMQNVNLCEPENTLIVWDGARFGLAGYGQQGAVGSTLMKLTPSDEIYPKYYYYFIKSKFNEINASPRGVGIPHVEPSLFWNLTIHVPPFDEQQRIVERIEEIFSKIDAGRSNLNQVELLAESYKQSLYKSVFDQYVPVVTQYLKVNDLAKEVRYGSSKQAELEGDIPVLRMGNLNSDSELFLDSLKYFPNDHDEFPALLLQKGDLLFNRTNSAALVGKTTVYQGKPDPCSFASYLIRVRFKENINPEFIAYYINSYYGRMWINSVVSQQVGQANVNGTKLKNFKVPVPDVEIQNIVVEKIKEMLVRVAHTKEQVRQTNGKIGSLKQATLQKAFSGNLA